MEITDPRDRAGTFEPVLVKKRQRRLGGIDEMVLAPPSAPPLLHPHDRDPATPPSPRTAFSQFSPSPEGNYTQKGSLKSLDWWLSATLI